MSVARRTCTELLESDSGNSETPRTLDELRGIGAYVLLGAPGAGKTTSFDRESKETDSALVLARDFVTLGIRPEWQGRTLFIDGLDEIRAVSADPRHPLDRIRTRLDELGRPEFRISCRDMDWLGANDWKRLKAVSPSGTVRVFRLDRLDQEGILKIVGSLRPTITPEAFVEEARRRGIKDLLENPQSLTLLLRATRSGTWPESRIETYERACESLSLETNDEHLSGNPNRPATSSMLEAAGRLCAILIMTGTEGFSFRLVEGDRRFVRVNDAIPDGHETARYAVRSRLFTSTGSITTDVAVPVHRYVSEFLAGRYLARLVGEGTPVSRVLALLTGYDGYLVSEFQGLSAWLAAHCKESRALIMDRDPVGTLLYGDVSVFSCDEKTKLIQVVARHLERHKGIEDLLLKRNSSVASLATQDMAKSLLAVMSRPDKDSAAIRATILALRAIQFASRDPGLGGAALELVKNRNNHPRIRTEALEACIRHAQEPELNALLKDIWSGTIADPEDELLGRLLTYLYPTVVGPAQVVSYLRFPRNPRLYGSYSQFWQSRVRDEANVRRIAELLDALVETATTTRGEFDERHIPEVSFIRHLPSSLLARFLRAETGLAGSDRICAWLELISDKRVFRSRADDWKTIRQWLADRPGTVESIFRIVVERQARAGDLRQCVDRAQRLMLGVPFPPGFERWCDERGRRASDDRVARVFLGSSRTLRERSQSGTDYAASIENQRGPEPSLEELLEGSAPVEQSALAPSETATDTTDPEKLEWRSQVRAREPSLLQNRCSPAFLEGLAEVYFGNSFLAEGADPMERLHDLLGEKSLVDAALTGLRESVTRDDVPTESEILGLHSQDRWHRLALPVLAGVEEIDRGPTPLLDSLGREQLRIALAFHFTARREHMAPYDSARPEDGGARVPRWFRSLVESDPGLVAGMMIESVRSEIRKGLVLYDELRNLLQDESRAEIARRVSLPLLNLIPARCNRTQLDGLELVLKSAMLHCDKRTLHAVIEEKLARSSMNDGQRVYWLTAGLFVESSRHREELEQFVALDDHRIGHLVAFIAGSPNDGDWHLPFESLDTASLESLVLRGGKLHQPLSQHTQAVKASALIESLVRQLGSDPLGEATDSLARLLLVPHLEPWRFVIQHWQRQQREVRRNASYAYASIEQVGRTLAGFEPANATDLFAATVDCLRALARDFRDGHTSGWGHFWNCGETPTPRHEESWRNLLLDLLQARLERMGVDAQPEGRYADAKRADIRISCSTFNVPVEIKRSTDRKLWSAFRSQLIRKYVRDPGTDGHGIYLVLWFGNKGVPMPPSGARPQSAQELEKRLQDSLSFDERLKISIVVIDVARPGSQ